MDNKTIIRCQDLINNLFCVKSSDVCGVFVIEPDDPKLVIKVSITNFTGDSLFTDNQQIKINRIKEFASEIFGIETFYYRCGCKV